MIEPSAASSLRGNDLLHRSDGAGPTSEPAYSGGKCVRPRRTLTAGAVDAFTSFAPLRYFAGRWGTSGVNGGTYACSSVIRPTTPARKMLCQTTALKMSASLPSWCVAAVATHDALGVDHLAHDAAGAVGRADQHLGLAQVEVARRRRRCRSASAVIFCRLPNRALLPASVPVRKTPSQPRIGGEERVEDARAGEGDAERRVHAGVARDVAQAEHEGDGRDRDLHLDERAPEHRGRSARRFMRSRTIDSSAARNTAVPGAVSQAKLNSRLLRLGRLARVEQRRVALDLARAASGRGSGSSSGRRADVTDPGPACPAPSAAPGRSAAAGPT